MGFVWFWLVAVMIVGYVVLDGFDLGVGVLHLFLPRDEAERRASLRSIGPVWDGNEVWLLAGGGTLIRGFPELVAAETGMPVYRTESPLTCVAVGSGQALDHLDQLSVVARQLGRSPTTPDWRTAQP